MNVSHTDSNAQAAEKAAEAKKKKLKASFPSSLRPRILQAAEKAAEAKKKKEAVDDDLAKLMGDMAAVDAKREEQVNTALTEP